jgi:hypothetical protein
VASNGVSLQAATNTSEKLKNAKSGSVIYFVGGKIEL